MWSKGGCIDIKKSKNDDNRVKEHDSLKITKIINTILRRYFFVILSDWYIVLCWLWLMESGSGRID
jgi:hypothetical protein